MKKKKRKKQEKLGMTTKEVKKYLESRFWDKFGDWISGQTCPLWRGKLCFYKHDVERFTDAILERKVTYFD